ncbi:uncharacterized protein LOC124285949 isoform X2 [Haliotis rubra]|uniref:uncharacterized protein LOC124285949 isoform X2 n=1 Tax=Haliotis rubra TaxID=36100 RepID=UPI001EE507EE|nr:uncharacterized protein LOC124285949 isoform X2 [Haliotis rubra]
MYHRRSDGVGKSLPDQRQAGSKVRHRQGKQRPNYFVALQITNPEIHQELTRVQQHVVSVVSEMRDVMVDARHLHVTLMVMKLDTEDEMARARKALDECVQVLGEKPELPVFEVAQLGTFGNKVVFAQIPTGEDLDQIKYIDECVRGKMAEQGIYSTDSRPLNPHISIMNMEKVGGRFRHTVAKRIEPSLYGEFKSSKFGCQTVRSIQLCLMDKPRAESGYYRLAHEVYLDSKLPVTDQAAQVLACSSFGADHQAASRMTGEEEVLSTRETAWGGREQAVHCSRRWGQDDGQSSRWREDGGHGGKQEGQSSRWREGGGHGGKQEGQSSRWREDGGHGGKQEGQSSRWREDGGHGGKQEGQSSRWREDGGHGGKQEGQSSRWREDGGHGSKQEGQSSKWREDD